MKTLYQSDDGEIYEEQEHALLADVLHEAGVYLERWKKEEVVEALSEKLIFYSKVPNSPIITSSLQDTFNGTHDEETDLNDILDPNQ